MCEQARKGTSRQEGQLFDNEVVDSSLTLDQIDVLLNASGAKIKHLKNLQLEAAPGGVAARGIWSSIHDKSAAHGGYKI
jgi:large subunit ribosomal protein L43